MPKLTKNYIDKITAPADKEAFHWDDSLKGFGLRVTPTGKITYIVQGRVNGSSPRISIGPHGVFTVDQARDVAREHLRSMRMGIDPRAVAKKEAAQRVTLRDVADAYKRDRPLKDSSKAEIERHVTTTFEAWLKKPLKDINREAVTKRFNEIKTKGTTGNGPAPAQANQAFAVLRALFNYAIREYREPDGSPVLTDNPVDVLYKKWAPLKPRTSRVPDSKVGAVWSFLTKARDDAYNRDTLASIDLVILLMLTGLRIGECCALEWNRVNLEEGWIHIPDPKNSNPVWLPLSTQAVHLLTTRQRVKGSPFVFSSWGKAGHIKDPRDTMKKVSEVAGTKITPHDLRRTFTTIGIANCGIDLTRVELLTNHVPKGVTARHYLETSHLQYLKPETQRISDWIEQQAAAINDHSER
ncbi:TPA: site-specific integrase [Pseudomonas aeruginosa]|uniref:tyrosine-type recombinase/integrase n=1 Tax=Pseudomonas aeruginosa TaxID=287 RepID=UPI001A22B1F9|nr:site-specific integrase [Pseudomonas aeruginosa]MBF2992168.1 site-specific integrase [Pseudomonas aeruginosa]MBG7240471.1 site-specific integrase [Pseudomonas aeruginosa]MDY1089296.1 site-specific integrase [Pseudomonas aeruginosa]HBO2438127.1 site-specific integrase [Pseudomonas aeruginosa]HBO2465418.1 site-specific integrase [Pseudomonas aeruginosa]